MNKKTKNMQYCYTILCEDIRLEVNNKLSLMGVFKDLIYLKKMPLSLPTLTFYQTFTNVYGKYELKFELLSPKGELLAEVEAKVKDTDGLRLSGIPIKFNSATFDSEGLYQFKSSVKKGDHFKEIANYRFEVICDQSKF